MGKDVDKKLKIDETDIDIIRHLQDGRKSFKRIAEELSLAENTVRSRVTKLIESGVLQITGSVVPGSIPPTTRRVSARPSHCSSSARLTGENPQHHEHIGSPT